MKEVLIFVNDLRLLSWFILMDLACLVVGHNFRADTGMYRGRRKKVCKRCLRFDIVR